MLVFALAIAPKQMLHDAIATHKHHYAKSSPESQIINYAFSCDCDNLVAESPFVDFTDEIIISSQPKYAVFFPQLGIDYQPISLKSFRLRGPPSLV